MGRNLFRTYEKQTFVLEGVTFYLKSASAKARKLIVNAAAKDSGAADLFDLIFDNCVEGWDEVEAGRAFSKEAWDDFEWEAQSLLVKEINERGLSGIQRPPEKAQPAKGAATIAKTS